MYSVLQVYMIISDINMSITKCFLDEKKNQMRHTVQLTFYCIFTIHCCYKGKTLINTYKYLLINISDRVYITTLGFNSVDTEPMAFGDCQFLTYVTIRPTSHRWKTKLPRAVDYQHYWNIESFTFLNRSINIMNWCYTNPMVLLVVLYIMGLCGSSFFK